MILHKHTLYVLLILTTLIHSCERVTTLDQSKESSFSSLFPDCRMNTIIVFLPPQPNNKPDQFISLLYQNRSESQIVFAPDAGVKILVYQEADSLWVELTNNMQYSASPNPYLLLDAEGVTTSYGDLVVSPDFSKSDKIPREIRIVITGHVFQNEKATNQCVGAFIDIQP